MKIWKIWIQKFEFFECPIVWYLFSADANSRFAFSAAQSGTRRDWSLFYDSEYFKIWENREIKKQSRTPFHHFDQYLTYFDLGLTGSWVIQWQTCVRIMTPGYFPGIYRTGSCFTDIQPSAGQYLPVYFVVLGQIDTFLQVWF